MTDFEVKINNDQIASRFGLAMDRGDIATRPGLRSTVIYLLFTDQRAQGDELLPGDSLDRRGFWADQWINQSPLNSEGSLLWLLRGAPETDETLLRAENYARVALQVLITNNVAVSVDVRGRWLQPGVLALALEIPLVRGGSFVEEIPYILEAAGAV